MTPRAGTPLNVGLILSILIPGTGHFFIGQGARGLLILVIWILGLLFSPYLLGNLVGIGYYYLFPASARWLWWIITAIVAAVSFYRLYPRPR